MNHIVPRNKQYRQIQFKYKQRLLFSNVGTFI